MKTFKEYIVEAKTKVLKTFGIQIADRTGTMDFRDFQAHTKSQAIADARFKHGPRAVNHHYVIERDPSGDKTKDKHPAPLKKKEDEEGPMIRDTSIGRADR